MPQTEIDIACPGCNAVFSVPIELCGEMAECTECSAVFEIPLLDEVPPTLESDSGAVKGVLAPAPPVTTASNEEGATNTVKLSRTSIGMIPGLKDSFIMGMNAPARNPSTPSVSVAPPKQPDAPIFKQPVAAPPRTQAQQQPAVASPGNTQPPPQKPVSQPQVQPQQPKLTFTKPPSPPIAKPMNAPPPPPAPAPAHAPAPHIATSQGAAPPSVSTTQAAQAVNLPSWTNVQLKQSEELQACREINKNPAVQALLSSLPVLLTIIALFFATRVAIAIAIVIIIWFITFVVAFMMTKNSSKRAIVITNQRTICIIGKDRIELKQ
jgi:hypothetical protein